MSAEKGFILGADGSEFTMSVLCNGEVAFTLSNNLLVEARTNIFNFMVFPNIDTVKVSGTKMLADNIGMFTHDFDIIMNLVLKSASAGINHKYNANGFPLANLNPTLGLLSGVLQKFTVSPLKFDQFLLFGFSMYADLPTLANYRIEDAETPVGATIIQY